MERDGDGSRATEGDDDGYGSRGGVVVDRFGIWGDLAGGTTKS
jgi:hypothetical protein